MRARALPFAVVGQATERQLMLADADARPQPRDMPMDVLLGKPPKMHRDVQARGSQFTP